MCDYSLEHVASRAANKGEDLISTTFLNSSTKGFAGVNDKGTAACLLPGTEIAFKDNVKYADAGSVVVMNSKVATFRQVDLDDKFTHHDALEFEGGKILKVSQLIIGQVATVVQLPVDKKLGDAIGEGKGLGTTAGVEETGGAPATHELVRA